jgi:predicted transcriptional regulator of viral defense system
VFYLTGKDIEMESEYAMNFDKTTACWQLLGDAQEYALTKERQEIIDCIKNGITHYADIAKALGEKSETIRKRLSRMKNEGQIVSLSKGEYDLVYPLIGCHKGPDNHNSHKVTSTIKKSNFDLKN